MVKFIDSMMKKKSNVLIIGSSSFIYELLHDYLDKSFEVYKISSKKIKDTYYFNFISLNKSDIKLRSKIFKNINFDLVLIFSNQRNLKIKSQINLKKSFSMFENIVQLLQNIKYQKVIFFSSFSVYEENQLIKLNKKVIDPIKNSDGIYGFYKLFFENFLKINLKNLIILRLPNIINYHLKNKSVHCRYKRGEISGSFNPSKIYKYFVSINTIHKFIIMINKLKKPKKEVYDLTDGKFSIIKALK